MYRQEKIHGIPGESFKTAGSLAPNRSYEVDLQSLIDKIKAENRGLSARDVYMSDLRKEKN